MSMIYGVPALFTVVLAAASATAGNQFQALPPQGGDVTEDSVYRRECGRVRITTRVLLEVSLGFNWERGVIDTTYFELLAGSSSDPKQWVRQERLSELVHGEQICVSGRLVNSDRPVPGIIPDELEDWTRTAELSK